MAGPSPDTTIALALRSTSPGTHMQRWQLLRLRGASGGRAATPLDKSRASVVTLVHAW
jgi:hypothetical protein